MRFAGSSAPNISLVSGQCKLPTPMVGEEEPEQTVHATNRSKSVSWVSSHSDDIEGPSSGQLNLVSSYIPGPSQQNQIHHS